LKITLVEPGASRHPVGGSLVVFEYANRLVALGHAVTIVFPVTTRRKEPFLKGLKLSSRFARWKRGGQWKPRWFSLDAKVRLVWARSITDGRIPDADVVVATVSEVVEAVAHLPARCGAKVYFAQIWRPELEPEIAKSWPLVVIARAMEAQAAAAGFHPVYIPNGLDRESFHIEQPLAARDPHSLCLLVNRAPHKGFPDAVRALEIVAASGVALKVTGFGTAARPDQLPPWMDYEQLPSRERLRALYNRSAIFISASLNEGWGLPACEAGLCGCALAVTENQGHREFAIHEQTALLSPPGQPEALAANVLRLIAEPGFRQSSNTALIATLAAFSWDESVERMAAVLAAAVREAERV
jgi:glycosyltransferase involved in cell wall biosynthesis